jgi:hypothetical protein
MLKLLLIIAMFVSGTVYGQEHHKVVSCNEDLSVCVENGVTNQANSLTSEDKLIFTQTCVINIIKDKVVYRCETRKGLPKYEPKEENPVVVDKPVKKNSIIVHAGVGPTGLKYGDDNGDNITISTKYGATGGVTYLRRLNDTYNVSGTALMNKTGLVGVGVDF